VTARWPHGRQRELHEWVDRRNEICCAISRCRLWHRVHISFRFVVAIRCCAWLLSQFAAAGYVLCYTLLCEVCPYACTPLRERIARTLEAEMQWHIWRNVVCPEQEIDDRTGVLRLRQLITCLLRKRLRLFDLLSDRIFKFCALNLLKPSGNFTYDQV
jgi:hypothetical protein